MTIVSAIKKIPIPFGVCQINKDLSLVEMKEKPFLYYLINAGIYVVNPQILDVIPYNQFYDINDFIKDIKKSGGKVGVYPIAENSWINIGSLDEFQKNKDKLL